MQQLFQNILTASFHGSVVILAVIVLRLVLKKTPKKFLCFLWLLAGIRLLMPFEIQSTLSLQSEPIPAVESAWQEMLEPEEKPAQGLPQPEVLQPQQNTLPEQAASVQSETIASAAVMEVTVKEREPLSWAAVLPWFWLAVTGCFAIYSLYSYLTLRHKVREAVKIPGGYECADIETAFILGFIRPKIYIPMGMSKTVRKHILAHERTHLEKGDHWFKMVGFLALSLHWFNPLAWIAYILLCKDIEMACDERVVQFMELDERKEYAAALLNCSTNRIHFAACPVAFGEVSVKYRILSVLNYKKPSFWISLLGVIAIGFVAVCLVTSPTESHDPVSETVAEDGRRVVVVETVDQFLNALAPNTVVQLEAGAYNLCEAENYGKTTGTMYYSWGECYDGYQLVLYGMENLTIRGSGKLVTSIDTEPRYANVLYLQNCANVTMEGFTAGHTKGAGECSGGVVYVERCKDVEMSGLGLYGCGIMGLQTESSSNVTLKDSDVYDCSNSGFSFNQSTGVTIDGCRIYNIGSAQYGGYAFFGMTDCDGVRIANCEISDSTLMYLLSASGSRVELQNNLFVGNRARDAAFSIHGDNVVLEGNQFKDNNIRQWYDSYGNFAVDRSNNPITNFQQTMTKPNAHDAAREQVEIHVSTVDELIAAIGPDREIVLDGKMYDFSTATGYGSTKGDYYFWEDIYDGPGLVICNVDNMTIRSVDGNVTGHTIAAIPRYADVLAFSACSNVTLSGFTAGHTKEPGSCAGGVIEFRDCDNMTVDKCGLYGCGILGVSSEYCSNITVKNSDIYECSQGGISLRDTTGILLENNTFRDLGGDETAFVGCANITVDGKKLDGNGQWKESIGSLTDAVQENAGTQQAPEDVLRLQETALNVADAYFRGQKDDLKEIYLSSDYNKGEFPVYQGDGREVTLMDVSVPKDYASDMESMGFCVVSVMFTEGNGEKQLFTTQMVRENGIWKARDYYVETRNYIGMEVTTDNIYVKPADQNDLRVLEETAVAFGRAYFAGYAEEMSLHLSETFEGTIQIYSNMDSNGMVIGCDIPEDYAEQTNFYGRCTARIPYNPDIRNATREDMRWLDLEMVREGGGWKVAGYGLEDDGKEDLIEVLMNFRTAYFNKDADMMRTFLSADYDQPIVGYPGDNLQIEFGPFDPDVYFSGKTVGDMNECTVSMPFKATKNSDSYDYLTLFLEWEGGNWKITDFGLEK